MNQQLLPGYGARQLDGHARRRGAAGPRGDPCSPAEVADCWPRPCRPRREAPSPKMIDAGAQAVGLTPVMPIDMLRDMWVRGHHHTVSRVRSLYGLAS